MDLVLPEDMPAMVSRHCHYFIEPGHLAHLFYDKTAHTMTNENNWSLPHRVRGSVYNAGTLEGLPRHFSGHEGNCRYPLATLDQNRVC